MNYFDVDAVEIEKIPKNPVLEKKWSLNTRRKWRKHEFFFSCELLILGKV